MTNTVKFTSRSYYSVYDPNAPDGAQHMEYESTSRGVRENGSESISETHRKYKDSAGNQRIGLARSLGDQGRLIQRERDALGREKAYDRVSHPGLDGTGFDNMWQRSARQHQLDQIPFLNSRSLIQNSSAHPSPHEVQAARRGNQVFQEQTARIMEQARQSRPPPSQERRRSSHTRQQSDRLALNLAHEEAQNLWNS